MEEENVFANEESGESKPIFDFRNDYYKIIRWELVLFAKAYVTQDYEQCHRVLRDLYSNVRTFFTSDENTGIAESFTTIRVLIKEAGESNRRDPAFQQSRAEAIYNLEDKLMDTKESIMDLLKKYNMLLPMSAGKMLGFDESTFMSESDL